MAASDVDSLSVQISHDGCPYLVGTYLAVASAPNQGRDTANASVEFYATDGVDSDAFHSNRVELLSAPSSDDHRGSVHLVLAQGAPPLWLDDQGAARARTLVAQLLLRTARACRHLQQELTVERQLRLGGSTASTPLGASPPKPKGGALAPGVDRSVVNPHQRKRKKPTGLVYDDDDDEKW